MLKKYGQLFTSALWVSDTLAVVLSWLAAYHLRFSFDVIPITQGVPELDAYLLALPVIGAIFIFNIRLCGLYQPLAGRSHLTEYYNIVKVTSLSIIMITAASFFYRGASYSRAVVVMFWAFATGGMAFSHMLLRRVLMRMRRKGFYLTKVLIVGAGELGQTVARKIDLHPEIGFAVAGYLSTHPEKTSQTYQGYPVLGMLADVSTIIRTQKIRQLFIALPLWANDRLEQVLTHLGEETVDIKVVPDLLKFMNIHSGVEDFDGMPVVSLTGSPLYGWNVVIKRAMDFAVSTVAIVLTAPLMGAIIALIRWESRGPTIFRQDRVGLDGKVFSMMKFRSMRLDAEDKTGPVWAKPNDDRCTPLGSLLRRTSLDELPQLFNVWKGDMSLVGPRPERPVFVEDFKKSIPQYMLRHKMKAGLTGWAQVNGWRGNTSLQKRIEYDLYYIKNWSMWFDVKIMIMTLWRGFINRHAY